VEHITETINHIKAVKFYSWQDIFEDEIRKRRSNEMDSYMQQAKWSAISIVVLHFLNSILGSTILSVYIGTGHTLTVSQAFTALMYIGMAIGPMRSLPHFYNSY
jgi:ABC-type multidrug transport system fused ATPase/permease subunit